MTPSEYIAAQKEANKDLATQIVEGVTKALGVYAKPIETAPSKDTLTEAINAGIAEALKAQRQEAPKKGIFGW